MGAAPALDTDLTQQRAIVDAFLTAARSGGFDALLEALDPDVAWWPADWREPWV